MVLQRCWCIAAAVLVWTGATTQASWPSIFADVIPGLRTSGQSQRNATVTAHDWQRYDDTVEEMLTNVIEAHGLDGHERRREKRSTATDFSIRDTLGVQRLQFLTPLAVLCERQLFADFVEYDGKLYGICVSAGTRYAAPTLTVGILEGNVWKPIAQTKCVDPTMAVAFPFNNKLYIVTADAGLENGAELQFFDKDTRKIYIDHTIHSTRPTAVAFWQMQSTGEYNLALANSGKEVSTSVYSWRATYFDKYATIDSKMVRDLEPFAIHNIDFLTVVNQRLSEDTAKVSTVIYKYDLSQSTWKTFQQIATYAATDAEFFSMGRHKNTKDFFLAIANHYEQIEGHRNYAVDSIVYKYVEGKFVPFQCLHTTGATKLAAFEGADGEFLLAVASLYEPVHLFQYNGWRFVLSDIQYTRATMGPGTRHLSFSYPQPNKEIVMIVSNPVAEGSGLYRITFYHDNQIQRWYEDSLNWCESSRALSTEESAGSLASQLDNVFYTDRAEPIHLAGEVVIQDLQVAQSLRASKFEELATGEHYSIDKLEELENLEIELNRMKETIEQLFKDLNSALKVTGDQVVTGDWHFDSLKLDCPSTGCRVGNLRTDYLNKEDVTALKGRLVFTDVPQTIGAPMAFDHLTVDHLSVDGNVNGIPTSKLVTLSGDHVLAGNIKFTKPVYAQDVFVSGLLGEHRFTPNHLLLTEGNQVIAGEYTLPETTVQSLQVQGLCNGINVTRFYETALTTDGNHVVRGSKTFQQFMVDGTLSMDRGSLFNGVDMEDLWKNVMWKQGDQVVVAPHDYSSVQLKDVRVKGTVNGIQLPGPDTVLLNEDVKIPAEKVFLSDCYADELHVNVALNGLQRIRDPTSDWKGQLDILVKTPFQRIVGRKTFKSMLLNGNSGVGRFVDGVDLSALAEVMRRKRTSLMNGTWTFTGNVLFETGVTVAGLVNGHKLNDLYTRALRLNAPVFPNFERVVFTQNVVAKSVVSRDINGFDVPSSFVLRRGAKVISGEKIFRHLRLTSDVTVKGLLNGVDLGVLGDALFSAGNQVVKAPKVFKRNVHIRRLVVRTSINGVNVAEFCRLDENCVFTAPKDFESLTVKGGISVDNLVVLNTLNGIRVPDLFQNTLLYTAPQTVRGMKTFTTNVTVPRNTNVQASNFSGFSLAELYADAVLLNDDQVVTGDKVFAVPVRANDFHFHSTLDGIAPGDLTNWMLHGVAQTVSGDLVFQSNLETLGSLEVSKTINGVDLNRLANTIAFKNESVVFAGPMRFGFLASTTDVEVTGTVQGVDVSEEVVDATKDAVVHGRKFLKSGFDVGGDLWVNGLFDSVKVEDLCNKTVRTSGRQVVSAPTTVVGDVVFRKGARIGGLLDRTNLREVDTSCLKTTGGVVRGPKKFKNLGIRGPLTLRGSINGRNLEFLKSNYMSLTRDQVVQATMKMPTMQIQGSLHCGGVDASTVNGVHLPRFMNSVLRTVGDQVISSSCRFGNLAFNGDVTVGGNVNGVRLPEDVLSKTRSNVVAGPLEILGDVKVKGGLTMPESARLQGVDVPAWARTAVLNDGRQYVVKGRKMFNNLAVDNAQIGGTLDGIKVSPSELLLTTGDQVITGKKVFGRDLVANKIRASGLINGVDLKNFMDTVMLKSRPNTVTAPQRFLKGFQAASLRVFGKVSNISVDHLKETPQSVRNLQPLVAQLQQHDSLIDKLGQAFKEQALVISHYDTVFAFTLGPSRSTAYAQLTTAPEDLLLLSLAGDHRGCGTLKVYRMQRGHHQLLPAQQDIPVAEGATVHHAYVPGADFIIVVNKNSVRACCKTKPTLGVIGAGNGCLEIFTWHRYARQLELYQVIKFDTIRSVSLFRRGSTSCIALIAGESLKVVCVGLPSEGFRLYQDLPIHYSTGVSAHYCPSDQKVLMAVSASQLGQPDKLFIYEWSERGLKKLASIPFVSISSMTVIGHTDKCFVVVGQNKVAGAHMPVSVYRYVHNDPQAVFEVQKLLVGDVKSLSWIASPDGLSPLVFVHTHSTDKNLQVFSYKGSSGFVQEDALHVDDHFQEVRVFRRSDGRHYITMSRSQDEPSAVVLVSKVKGKPCCHR